MLRVCKCGQYIIHSIDTCEVCAGKERDRDLKILSAIKSIDKGFEILEKDRAKIPQYILYKWDTIINKLGT